MELISTHTLRLLRPLISSTNRRRRKRLIIHVAYIFSAPFDDPPRVPRLARLAISTAIGKGNIYSFASIPPIFTSPPIWGCKSQFEIELIDTENANWGMILNVSVRLAFNAFRVGYVTVTHNNATDGSVMNLRATLSQQREGSACHNI